MAGTHRHHPWQRRPAMPAVFGARETLLRATNTARLLPAMLCPADPGRWTFCCTVWTRSCGKRDKCEQAGCTTCCCWAAERLAAWPLGAMLWLAGCAHCPVHHVLLHIGTSTRRPMPPTAALCTPCLRCREHFGPSVGLFEQDPHLQNVYELDSSTPSKHSRHLLVRCARCRALNLGLLRTGRREISADSVAGRMHFAVRAILLLVLLVHHRSTQCGPTGAACAGGTSGTVTDLPGSLQVRLPGHAFLDNQHCGKFVREVRAAIGACGCAGRWRRCARRQRARRQPARAPQTNIFAYSTRFSLHPLHLLGCASCSPWPAAMISSH